MKYLITTTSNVLYKKTLAEIKNKNLVEDDSIHYFDIDEIKDMSEISSLLFSGSIFNEKRIVVIKNVLYFKNKKTEVSDFKKLENFFKTKTDNILVLLTDQFNKDNDLFLEVKDYIEVVNIEAPVKLGLYKFVEEWMKKNGITYSIDMVKKLIESSLNNFDIIYKNLQKLKLANIELSNENFDKIIYDFKEQNIFKMVDFIFKKDAKGLIQIIDKLNGDSISTYLMLQRIIDDFILAALLKNIDENGGDDISIVSGKMKINEFRANKLFSLSQLWNIDEMISFIENLLLLKIDVMKNSNDHKSLLFFKSKLVLLIT